MPISSGNNPGRSPRIHNAQSSSNFTSNAGRSSGSRDSSRSRSASERKAQDIGAQYFDRSSPTHPAHTQNFSRKYKECHGPNHHSESKNHQEVVHVSKKIKELVQRKDLVGAFNLIESTQSDNLNSRTFQPLFKEFSVQCDLEKAQTLFKLMKHKKISPNEYTYGSMISCACRAENVPYGEILLEEMQRESIQRNRFHYEPLVKKYLYNKKNVKNALKLIEEMIEDRIIPDIKIFNGLMNAYAQKGDPKGAERVLNMMEREGVLPDVAAYNTLMNVYAQKGDPEGAEGVLRIMEGNKIPPDIATYNTLMNAYAQKRDPEGAEGVLRVMEGNKIPPDIATYNTLMNAYAQKRDPEGAEGVLKMMEKKGISPNSTVYSTLMNAHAQKGDPEGAERVLNMMEKKGLSPDIATYSTLMNAYILANNLPGARQIYEKLKIQMKTIPIEIYQTLINGYSKAKDYSSVLCIFEEQKIESFLLDQAPYTQVFEAYGKVHQAQKAQGLLKDLQATNSKVIDITHYNCVMNAFAETGNVEQVKALSEEAQKNGFVFDSCTISTILKAYVRGEEPKEGLIFVREHKSCKNVSFESPVYSQLISIHTKMRRPDGAEYWLNKMCAANLTPSKSMILSIMRSYSQLGDFKGIKRIVEYAKRYGYTFDEKRFGSCCEVQTKDATKIEEISSVPISSLKPDHPNVASVHKVELPKVILPVDPHPALIPQVLSPQVTVRKESTLAYKFVQNKNNYVGLVSEDHQLKETSQQFHVTPCAKTFIDPRFSDQFQKAHEKFLEKKVILDPRYEAALKQSDKDKIKPDFVDIKKIDDRVGFGAFANTDIKPGTIIGEYIGKIVTWNYLDEEDPDCSYAFECEGNGEDVYQHFAIDACETGNFTRFFNHGTCKNRNLRAVHYFNESGPHILFETTRKIRAGEELRFNYGKKYWTIKEIDPIQS